MSKAAFWHKLPLASFIAQEWQAWHKEQLTPHFRLAPTEFSGEVPPYPIDMWPLLDLPHGPVDEHGVLYVEADDYLPGGYYATAISQYALANWNAYLATNDEQYKRAFLIQADWIATNEQQLAHDAVGWPFLVPWPDYHAEAPWLSALTQGNCISVLVRAYKLTGKALFLDIARRAVRTFEHDIRDGGVSVQVGEDGVLFEEIAAYPAAHILNGYLYGLFGLYDYIDLTGDTTISALLQRSLDTMHRLIDRFDMRFWSRYNLLHGHPATSFYHALHVTMLEALARYSGCDHCAKLAVRWAGYQRSRLCWMGYMVVSLCYRYRRGLRRLGVRNAIKHLLTGRAKVGLAIPPANAAGASSSAQAGDKAGVRGT